MLPIIRYAKMRRTIGLFLSSLLLSLPAFAGTYEVKLNKNGHVIRVVISASTPTEAQKISEHQYPGYRAIAVKVIKAN